MPYAPVPFKSFGGLDLTNDPFEVGPERAVDMLDVELTPQGGLRARDFLDEATALSLTDFHHMDYYDYQQIYYAPSIVGFRESAGTITINEMNVTAPTTYSATQRGTFASAQVVSSSATLGTSAVATPSMYFAFRDALKMRKLTYTGVATWTFPEVGTGRPRWLTVSPTDNRLVAARFTDATWSPTGANGSVSAVFFSDPGAPETWTASNWVALRPGDGEEITALVTWRDSVVAFKETACFVFYGTSTLSSGIAQFNYRPLTLPGKLQSNVVVGPDGMYFCTAEGVWVCDGIRFRKVSGAIEGVFNFGIQNTAYQPGSMMTTDAINGLPFWLSCARDRLYLNYDPVGSTWMTLVYDTTLDAWLRHSYRAVHVLEAPGQWGPLDGGPDLLINFGDVTAPGIYYTKPGLSHALTPYWQSGWYDLGGNEEKIIRQSVIHAGYSSGNLTYRLVSDTGTQVNTTAALPSAAMDDVYIRTTGRGRRFYHYVEGAGPFRVQGLTHYVRGQKAVGVDST